MSTDFPEIRRRKISNMLLRSGRVTVHDVVQDFAVSEDTARRDLKELEGEGLCKCVYGGALLVRPTPRLSNPSLGERRGSDGKRKEQLGRVLGGLVRPGQMVFLDAGSTNLAAARFLPDLADVTAVTHDPAIAALLLTFQKIRVICIGGVIDRDVGASLDASAMRAIRNLRPDLFLLGTCALDVEQGLSAFSYEDAQIKSSLVENASAVATGLLNEKLNTAAPYGICSLASVSTLVLEANAPMAAVQALQKQAPQLKMAASARH